MFKLVSTSLLIILLSTSWVEGQKSIFYKDAVQLAARLVEDNPSGEIPSQMIQSIESALMAVAESPSPAANAVMHQYNIHPLPKANTHNAVIIVDKKADWLKDLSKTPIHQAVPNIKELKLTQKEATDAYVIIDISCDRPVNMKFVANEISVVNDIWMVEVPTIKSDGSDVLIRKVGNDLLLTFAYKFKQCATGCEEAHYWEFNVSKNGTVEFLNEYGADLSALDQDDDFFTVIDELRP